MFRYEHADIGVSPLVIGVSIEYLLTLLCLQDLVQLVDAGLLTCDDAFAMSSSIIGLDLRHDTGHGAKFSQTKQFITPDIRLRQMVASKQRVGGA